MRIPVLTERDKSLLNVLDDYGVLSTKQLKKLIFDNTNMRTVLRRLRILEKEAKVITRTSGLSGGGLAWLLTAKGIKLVDASYNQSAVNKNTLDHDVFVNDIRIHLESYGIGKGWKSGHVLKRKMLVNKSPSEGEKDVVPDGFFAVHTKTGLKVVAMELERYAKAKSRYRLVFSKYARKNINFIWYIVPNEKFGLHLSELWKPYSNCNKNQILFWSYIDEVMSDPNEIAFRTKEKVFLLKDIFQLSKPDINIGK